MDYRYRIMHRPKSGGEWVHWMGKIYADKPTADRQIEKLRTNARFFGWGRDYVLHRQPINAEWEETDG